MLDLDDSMQGMKKGADAPSKAQIDKESEELLQKISGQRIKLKQMREGNVDEKSDAK